MMIGDHHRPNPTVHVPTWPFIDDPNHDMYSPSHSSTAAIATASDYSPYHVHEALAALQRYLPSNDRDNLDSGSEISSLDPDSPVDAYSCDHFRMYEFKVRRCTRGRSHDWTECPYAHPGEKARRRDPRKYHYSGTACPEFRKGNCNKGDACEFAHGVFECWLHPARYRTQPCKDGPSCARRVCFFAHTPEQLRVLPQQSPRGVNSPQSYDGSPLRQAFEISCAKTLPFFTSDGSISPPATPPLESPPLSPMTQSLSRSLGTNPINEMMASLRSMQLGKTKSVPSAWSVQVAGSGIGSPRVSMLRHGFSSLPTTPTSPGTRPGFGYRDLWEKGCDEEDPPMPMAMERVESGRDLRAKMFQKLSEENSLDRGDPDQDPDPDPSGNDPDVGWVSDLVK